MSVFVTVSKKNVSERGMGSHWPHGTRAGLNAISSPQLICIAPRRRIGIGGKVPQILNSGCSWITHFLPHARSHSRYALDWSPIGHRTGLAGHYNDEQSSCVTTDFPHCTWDLRFAWMLRSADWYLRTFRDNLSSPPSIVKQSMNAWPSQMGTTGCPETSVTNHQSRPRNIKEQQRLHQNSCPWCELNSNSPCYATQTKAAVYHRAL